MNMAPTPTPTPAEGAEPRPLRFLRLEAVIDRVGLERSAIYELQKEDDFPKAVPLTRRAVAWVEHEIEEWQRARIARRDGARP